MAARFEIGKLYSTRHIGNHDLYITIYVINRTEKTVKVLIHGKVKTYRLVNYKNEEFFFPEGRFSLAPVIRAEDRY